MGDFVIDTPNHKRWYLRNRKYQFNSFIYGSNLNWSVIRTRDLSTVLSGNISLELPNWQELAELAEELAEKKFPPVRERNLRDFQRSYK